MAYKAIYAKFLGHCKACGAPIDPGMWIVWESLHKTTFCHPCGQAKIAGAQKAAAVKVGLLKTGLAGHKTGKASMGVPFAPKPAVGIPPTVPPVLSGKVTPATQKGKGIHTLQQAGLLPLQMAIVCQTEDQAVAAFHKLSGQKRFCRPCPTQPRHGFVDSREVKTEDDVRTVWAETRAADPQGEVIMMPFVQATHNCVWRPGLLSCGPGHDGATAGHDSISVQLTPDFSQAWKDLATKAGVKLDTQHPFVEAVSNTQTDVIVTQIRGGDQDCPTEPDWIPAPMVVTNVIAIDQSKKTDSAAMLAWEEQAKHLPSGTIVWDEGGNQGDHWSVHARLNGVPVVTSFKPAVGQSLPKMGIDLVPLEPQVVIWGLLGALAGGPVMAIDNSENRRKRTRATVAAIMGAHHGLFMGGDSGAHLGASVGLFLRLSQAAVWGEARHAHSHKHGFKPADAPKVTPIQHMSRQQVFSKILDNWTEGRAGLRDVARVFHGSWSSGMGGKAWAAIAHAVVALDGAVIDLIALPSQTNVKKVVAKLVTAVNLAHNGMAAGCFLNKFATKDWFDMAAALDPRPACFAGPVWYEASLTDSGKRIALLTAMEAMEPIDIGFAAPTGNVVPTVGKPAPATIKTMPQTYVVDLPEAPDAPFTGEVGGKLGEFGNLAAGAVPALPGVPAKAVCKGSASCLHVQISLTAGGYLSGQVTIPEAQQAAAAAYLNVAPVVPSMSGSSVPYKTLVVTPAAIMVGPVVLLTLTTQP